MVNAKNVDAHSETRGRPRDHAWGWEQGLPAAPGQHLRAVPITHASHLCLLLSSQWCLCWLLSCYFCLELTNTKKAITLLCVTPRVASQQCSAPGCTAGCQEAGKYWHLPPSHSTVSQRGGQGYQKTGLWRSSVRNEYCTQCPAF